MLMVFLAILVSKAHPATRVTLVPLVMSVSLATPVHVVSRVILAQLARLVLKAKRVKLVTPVQRVTPA